MTEPEQHVPARLHLVRDTTAALFAPLIESWVIALEAENKSPKTIEGYLISVRDFVRWVQADRGTTEPTETTAALIRAWLADQLVKNSPATAKSRWVGMKSFCRWMASEGELEPNPMVNVQPPKVPEKPAEMFTLDQVSRLLKGCDGPLLVDRRDVAIISFFPDTGCRLGGVAGLLLDDLDLRTREARVLEKGDKERIVPFGASTARALDRYIRLRNRQSYRHLPNLWLSGKDGKAMTPNAIQQMVRRRSLAILGIGNGHPHMMRHLWADTMLKNEDMKEGDVMVLGGWTSRQMLGRYGAKTRAERARAAYQGKSPMDKL